MEFERCYRLGVELEAAGRYDEAFAAFAEANRLQRDPKAAAAAEASEVGGLNEVLQTFSPEFFGRNADGGNATAAPIFIIGFPRSGASLVERILAAHQQVHGLGELPALSAAVRGEYPIPLNAPHGPGHFKRLAGSYLTGVKAAGWRGVGSFTDRQPANRWLLGVARLMLPNATIVHTTRDPMDTCLSNYLVQMRGLPLGNDLGDIARQYVRYRTLIDHWVRALPGRMIHVNHEGLMANPEAMSRSLLDAVGLPWSDNCLNVLETQRPATASQARQPVDGETVGRWRLYEKHLGPLAEALGPYLKEVTT
jgi:hypothetical protein